MQVYAEETEPLIASTASADIPDEVDGMGEVDEVTARIFDSLDGVTRASSGHLGGCSRRGEYSFAAGSSARAHALRSPRVTGP